MMNKPRNPRHASSETGAMPRVDDEPNARPEPPMPTTLPEFDDDGGSITGAVIIKTEGEDEAKQADDSATRDDARA